MEDIMSWLRCNVGKDLKLVEYPERLPSASLQGNLKGYPEYPQRPTVLVILHQNCICRTRAWAAPVKTALASSLLNSLSLWWCILLISIKYKYKFYSTCVCSRPPRLMFSVLLGWCTQTMIVINGFFELSRYRTWGPPHQNDCAPWPSLSTQRRGNQILPHALIFIGFFKRGLS